MNLRRFVSLGGALVVAAIAALASYSHMRAVALRYGQPELIADLLPTSVDGMMAVATVALGDGRRNRWSAWLAFATGVTASVLANVLAAEASVVARCISAWPAVAFVLVVEVMTRGGRSRPGHTATSSAAKAGAHAKVESGIPALVAEPAGAGTSPRMRLSANTEEAGEDGASAHLADPGTCGEPSGAVPHDHPSRARAAAWHLRDEASPD
jgi:Protein of unknown function (DUF2637)